MLLIRFRFVFFLTIVLAINFYYGIAGEMKRPVIALVLSGGGAKGFAHIGALKILEEEGIPIDLIVGTSIGSIVGGLYSIGYSAQEIENMARVEDWSRILSNEVPRNYQAQNVKIEQQRYVMTLPVYERRRPTVPHGAINGQNVLNLFCDLAGNVPADANFNDFPIRFAAIGTDLDNGKEIIMTSGFLPSAIYSSMAIPGVFLPGVHNGHVLIDGGVINNFPTDVAKAMGADIIIGVDMRNDLHMAEEIRSMQLLMDQLINFYSIEKDSINKSNCDIIIRPDIEGYIASSFYSKAVDTLILRGMRAARNVLPEIRKLKAKYNLQPRQISRHLVKDSSWYITKINLKGDYSVHKGLIIDKLNLPLPGVYSSEQLKGALDRVYGLGCFTRVYYSFSSNTTGKTLNLEIEEKSISNFNVGIRLNTSEAVSVLINYTRNVYSRNYGLFSITGNLSSQPGVNITGEISRGNLPVMGMQIDGKYRNYSVYIDGKRSNSAEVYYGSVSAYSYKPIRNYGSAGMGIKEEFFGGNIFSTGFDTTSPAAESSISGVYAFYQFDNLDHFYYPGRGTELFTEASIYEDEMYDNINPVFLLKMRNYIPIHYRYVALLNFYARTILSENSPLMKSNYAGGTPFEVYMNNHLPFYGVPAIMPAERLMAIGLTGLRYNLLPKNYLTILANYLVQSDDYLPFADYEFIWGIGFTYSYSSKVGPIELSVGYSPWYDRPSIAASIGLWF